MVWRMGTVKNPDPERRGLLSKLGAPVILNTSQLSILQTALGRPENLGPGVTFCGFEPGIAVVFQGDDFSLELQFCFSCDELKVDLNGTEAKFLSINPGRPAFLGFFKDVFPEDKLIQSLPLENPFLQGKKTQ